MNARVTLSDIAKRASVHISTVSLALHDHPSLPPSTRQRIKSLAEEMGYRRDPELQALMAYRRSMNIRREAPPLAYITHWHTRWGWKDSPAHEHFHLGAVHKAGELGYKVEHFWLGEPGMTARRLSDILYARGISGLIFASHVPTKTMPMDFDWSRFAAVKIDYCPQSLRLHNVTNDQRSMIQLAMRRILQAGYRRIGMVMPRWWDEFVGRAWSAGFLAEQQDLEPEEQIPILHYGPARMMDAPAASDWSVPREEFRRWYGAYRPEVVLSYGRFVHEVIASLGISVPGDVAFADIFLHDEPGRTAGLRHNSDRVGEVAVEMLVAQLHRHSFGLPDIPSCTLVEGDWCDGRTLPVFGNVLFRQDFCEAKAV